MDYWAWKRNAVAKTPPREAVADISLSSVAHRRYIQCKNWHFSSRVAPQYLPTLKFPSHHPSPPGCFSSHKPLFLSEGHRWLRVTGKLRPCSCHPTALSQARLHRLKSGKTNKSFEYFAHVIKHFLWQDTWQHLAGKEIEEETQHWFSQNGTRYRKNRGHG